MESCYKQESNFSLLIVSGFGVKLWQLLAHSSFSTIETGFFVFKNEANRSSDSFHDIISL